MADRDSDEKFDKGIEKQEIGEKQAIGGQQSHRSEYGEQAGQTGDTAGQPIGGNDSATGSGTPLTQGSDLGGVQPGSGAMPRRSLGTRGTEFGQFGDHDDRGQQGQSGTGQADLGSQAGATLAGRADQQDFGADQPARVGGAGQENGFSKGNTGAPGSTGEGFIGAQGSGSDDLRQREGASNPASAKAAGGTDFARQGRGAADEEDEAPIEGQSS